MTKNARDKIAAGLREAIAVARGEEKPRACMCRRNSM